MARTSRLLLVGVALFMLVTTAKAQWVRVVVTRHDGGCAPCCPGTEIDEFLDPGEDATFNLSTCAKRVNITTSSSTVDIGRLTFTGGPGAFPLDIVLGSGSLNEADVLIAAVGRHWGGLDASGIGTSRFAGRIGGNLTGSVLVNEVFRFDVDGQVQAHIDADEPGNGGGFVVEAASISSSGRVRLSAGNIKRVRTFSGDIEGPITALSGGITQVTDVAGDLLADIAVEGSISSITVAGEIGTSTSPVSITTSGDIRAVVASAIFADIVASDPGGDDTWDVWLLEVTSGTFSGSLSLDRLRDPEVGSEEGVFVDGDLDADITISRSVLEPIEVEGDFLAGRIIEVGRNLQTNTDQSTSQNRGRIKIKGMPGGDILIGESLFGPIVVEASGGLQGQVIINARDDGGVWMTGDDGTLGNGSVTVDGVSLAPIPWYDQTSVSLGGGAAGVVPFSVHFKDCSPASSTLRDDECENYSNAPRRVGPGSAWPSVSLHHYGSITAVGEGKPFTVRRKPVSDTSCDWQDVTASFSHTMHPGGATRAILISGPFVAPTV